MQEVKSRPVGSVPHWEWPPGSVQGYSTRAIPAVVSAGPLCAVFLSAHWGTPRRAAHIQIVNVRDDLTTALLQLSPLAGDSQPRWQPEVAWRWWWCTL